MGRTLFGVLLSPLLSGIFLLAVGKREVDQYAEIRITPQYANVKAGRSPIAIFAHLVGWSLLVLVAGMVTITAIRVITYTPSSPSYTAPETTTVPLPKPRK
jgi:hypothetical protein